MAQLPVNRTLASTAEEHLADHLEVHRLHNILDGSTAPSTGPTITEQAAAPTDPAVGDLWLDTDETASPGTSGPAAADLPRGNFADSFTLTSIPTDSWTNPPWADNNNAGLLDLTDPTQPVLIRGGLIAVCIEWQFISSAETTGKTAYVELDLDLNGADWNVAGNFSLDPLIDPGNFQVQCPLSVTAYVPAGGVLSVAVQHNVGSAKNGRLAQASLHYLVLDPAP